ncbi:Protein krueppel [Gryllus bimaculatus]|nr:Protein krueppel [Gryllus bimaculatus]
MAEPILCVSWNNYANELATVCKLLLEKDFLVDCTIAAEGQSLKAHRLILSACSPYFCNGMLFSGEKEKHPIVILKDTLFDTLKKVIDFVYHGKAEIPANQLTEFLELAVSLQIKGLNNSLQKDRETNVGSNGDGNVRHNASSVNQDIPEVESSSQNCEPSSSNSSHYSSQKHHYHNLHPDTKERDSPDECRNVYEMLPLHDPVDDPLQDRYSGGHDDSVHTEINVKCEPLHSEIEIDSEGNAGLDEASSRNFGSEINERPSEFEQDLDQYSCKVASEPKILEHRKNGTLKKKWKNRDLIRKPGVLWLSDLSPYLAQIHLRNRIQSHDSALYMRMAIGDKEFRHANGSSALVRPLKQRKQCQENKLQQQQQQSQQKEEHEQLQQPTEQLHLSRGKPSIHGLQRQQSSYDLSSSSGLATSLELTLPASERTVGEESNEHEDANEVRGNDTSDVTKHMHEQNVTTRSSAEGAEQPEDQPTTAAEPRLHVRLRRKSDGTFTPCDERRLRSGPQPFLRVDSLLEDGDLDAHRPQLAEDCPHSCDVCGKSFTKACALSLHKRRHKIKRPYACDVCGKLFTTAAAVGLHKRWHKRGSKDADTRRFSCDVCGKVFTTPAAVAVHRRWHTKGKSYSCNVCEKAFTKVAALTIHKRKHKREKSYSSVVSKKALPKVATLTTQKDKHKGENTYLCDLCGKIFTKSAILLNHMRTHTGERPYVCEVCGKGFTQSGSLTAHKRLHTGERPYQCDVCGKAFARLGSFSVHKQKHVEDRPTSLGTYGKTLAKKYAAISRKCSDTKRRSCTCDVCGKTFSQSSSIPVHMRLHTGERPFKCDLCGKAYAHSSNLNVHMRTHTGERPYPCDVCGRAFINSSILLYHKRRFHTGERPFGCDACSCRFFLKSALITHWQRYHATSHREQSGPSGIPRE